MSRLTKLNQSLKEKHLEAVVILSDYNRRYLSGFTGTSGALIITESKQLLITDFRYIEQATSQAPDFTIIKQQGELIDEVKQQLEQLNVTKNKGNKDIESKLTDINNQIDSAYSDYTTQIDKESMSDSDKSKDKDIKRLNKDLSKAMTEIREGYTTKDKKKIAKGQNLLSSVSITSS